MLVTSLPLKEEANTAHFESLGHLFTVETSEWFKALPVDVQKQLHSECEARIEEEEGHFMLSDGVFLGNLDPEVIGKLSA